MSKLRESKISVRNVEMGHKYTPLDADAFDVAVESLFYDLNDRSGFDTGDIDEEIIEEWKNVWKNTLKLIFDDE